MRRVRKLFAVIRIRGGAWQDSAAIEEQAEWNAHRSFMNALEKEGFVVLGGPLEGTLTFSLSSAPAAPRRS